jgi:hypothetical protein
MKRKWIDLLLFYATVMIILSGIVLYIMPHGRVAYFTGWKFLGIDKDGWDNLHVIFGFLMIIVAIWHIIVNWKVMKKYLLQKESIFALLITAIISIGTLTNIQPFKSVSVLEEMIKNSWEVNNEAIPVKKTESVSIMPGGEYGRMALEEVCKKENIDVNKCIEKLKQKGIKTNPKSTLREIASPNRLTPIDIIDMIKK